MDNSLAIRDNILDNITKQIPSEIVSLLWFKNGPFENFVNEPLEDDATIINGIKVTFQSFGQEEPSLIDFSLPVTSSQVDEEEANSLSYYPSYASMSPGQRKTYLNWLCNIDSPINISYVFVFYYGLERHLYLGNFHEATETVVRLLKKHTNKSLFHYATSALIGSSIFRNNFSIIEDLLNDEYFCSHFDQTSPEYLAYMHYNNNSLSVDNVLSLSKNVGFTNTRYLKSDYSLFRQELGNALCKKYPEKLIPLREFALDECPVTTATLAANTSLSKIRYRTIPDLRNNVMFSSLLHSLLTEAHESVKQFKKEQRKRS